jgi:hypothetical protein
MRRWTIRARKRIIAVRRWTNADRIVTIGSALRTIALRGRTRPLHDGIVVARPRTWRSRDRTTALSRRTIGPREPPTRVRAWTIAARGWKGATNTWMSDFAEHA